jgi:hypothetical protein
MHRLSLPASVAVTLALLSTTTTARADEALTKEQATAALRQAVRFFKEEVSASGGYVWRVSADLTKHEGEGKAGPTTGWIEPPGTPSVGLAYLEAYELTGDPLLLEAAVEAGRALVSTQLISGGWSKRGIEFAPEDRQRYAYRADAPEPGGRRFNRTTFDDDNSQSALRLLMHLDRVLEFKNEPIREAAEYAREAFIKAQYPNGGWPQEYTEFPDPEQFPVKPASYPDEWPREFPRQNFYGYYTINDNTISDLITTMLLAWDIYGEDRYLESAKRGGEFFILAQMPDPQPGWAQQYNAEMHPAWARRFEPPAVTGGESRAAIRSLIQLYQRTGEERFLEPVPKALDYYRKSELPGGRLARFYELKTNRPLYFTKDYELTYSSDDMPTHYAFIVRSWVDRMTREYERARDRGPLREKPPLSPSAPRMTDGLRQQAREAVAAMDERGAWVEAGRLRYHGEDDETRQVIQSRTFIENLGTLARFIAAADG